MNARSVQPVLHAQAGHLVKIDEVAREQRHVVREANGGDLQIHRADADPLALQAMENLGGLLIKWEKRNLRKETDGSVKLASVTATSGSSTSATDCH